MANIQDYFNNQEQALLSAAKAAGILQSSTSKGRARERIVTDFLNANLPARVRAERGEVIDTGGRTSGETDVILVVIGGHHTYFFSLDFARYTIRV
jgi:hypothetical protein